MSNKERTHRIELLAPAKDLACGKAAINHGADAVYVGAPKFGARIAAGNPLNDIAELVNYAHRYWAKVYVALNTILYDDEIDEAHALVRSLYETGADALIIQDVGLLELDLPPIPLFASTQMHNYSIEKIQFLEKVGFHRVILARELSLKQLRDVRSHTSIDLEYFIHGALCVSFSGQCYLSYAIQGRSANRGECAQPCRMLYTLSDKSGRILEESKYLLSLKDLNLSEYLRDLMDAGVSSFKIEGRLKDINYVKNITAFYRQRIDELLEKDRSLVRASSGKTIAAFQSNPSKTFNRGFTEYFFKKRSRDILSPHTPKSTGAYVGTVQCIGRNWFILETNEKLHNGDGICFFDARNILQGTNINKIKGKKIFPSEPVGLEEGTIIYRNYDYMFAKELRTDATKRRISVKMQCIEINEGFMLEIQDEDGIKAKYIQVCEKVSAKNKNQAEEAIRHQLVKLGDTIFQCDEITVNWSQPYFLNPKVCNEMRREGIRRLEQERSMKYERKTFLIRPNDEPYPVKQLDYSVNVANKKAEAFYRRHGVESIEKAFELKKVKKGKTVMTMKHCLRFQYGLCMGKSNSDAEPLFLHDAKNRYRLEFDCEACQMKVILE